MENLNEIRILCEKQSDEWLIKAATIDYESYPKNIQDVIREEIKKRRLGGVLKEQPNIAVSAKKTTKLNKHLRSHAIIYSSLIIVLSVTILYFACSKYYTVPTEGFADQIGNLTGRSLWIILFFVIIWRNIPRNKKHMAILGFALIIMAIALYKSIVLLNEASSVKNVTNKLSSILTDINSGKTISNENIDMSKYGELTGLVELINDWALVVQTETENLYQKLEECKYSSIKDQEAFLQCILSSQCPFDFDESEIVLRQYEENISKRYDEYESKIKSSTLPEEIKQRFLSGFNKEKSLRSNIELIKLIKSYINEIKAFLDFMKKNESDWKYENGRFAFQSSENADIFNFHGKNYQRIVGEFSSLEKQLDNEFEQKQKELKGLRK